MDGRFTQPHTSNSHTCNEFRYTMTKKKLYHCKDGEMKIYQIWNIFSEQKKKKKKKRKL